MANFLGIINSTWNAIHHFFHNFRGNDIINDISIITLTEEVAFNNKIAPVCLPSSTYEDYDGEELTISGWGTLSHYGADTDKLQVAKVPYHTYEVCSGPGGPNGGRTKVTHKNICGGDFYPGKRSHCHGDSGGIYLMITPFVWLK